MRPDSVFAEMRQRLTADWAALLKTIDMQTRQVIQGLIVSRAAYRSCPSSRPNVTAPSGINLAAVPGFW